MHYFLYLFFFSEHLPVPLFYRSHFGNSVIDNSWKKFHGGAHFSEIPGLAKRQFIRRSWGLEVMLNILYWVRKPLFFSVDSVLLNLVSLPPQTAPTPCGVLEPTKNLWDVHFSRKEENWGSVAFLLFLKREKERGWRESLSQGFPFFGARVTQIFFKFGNAQIL